MSSLDSEECGEHQIKRMLQCAGKDATGKERNEIVDLVSFRCFEIGKKGPCSDGEVFVLNEDSEVRV